jgi:large subunit ribosomal protein L18e
VLDDLACQLYRFLARRTDSNFNKVVLHRLFMSKMNRPPLSVSKITKHVAKMDRKGKSAGGKIVVVVGTVTNDERKFNLPGMKICALRFTETARARIVAAGGECMTFDQLAMVAPLGENCLLLRGNKTHREANKHFGATGVPGSSTKCVHTGILPACHAPPAKLACAAGHSCGPRAANSSRRAVSGTVAVSRYKRNEPPSRESSYSLPRWVALYMRASARARGEDPLRIHGVQTSQYPRPRWGEGSRATLNP